MLRLLDMSIAITFIVLLLPAMLMMQGLLAINRAKTTRAMRQFQLEKIPLLFRVAKGKMSLRSFWKEVN